MATELDEALTAAGVPALVQKVIDPMLLEYQRRYSPLIRVTPTKKISSTTYYFNRRTFRAPGGFVTDGGARPMGNSVYEQFQFVIKLLQSVGGVTGYAQEVTRDQIGDLRAQAEVDRRIARQAHRIGGIDIARALVFIGRLDA